MIAAVDATPALRPLPSGTEVYTREIIEALAPQRGSRRLRLYANAALQPTWIPAGVEWRGIPFARLWTHWRFARAIADDHPNVVFVPGHVLPLVLRAPGVVTIHDVGHRHERGAYRPGEWLYLEIMTRWMARHARRLIAVSQSTANDLQRFYRVPPSRLRMIHSGVDERMGPQRREEVERVRAAYGLPDRYFLYVGRAHRRKNLPLLQRAFDAARRDGLGASLVLAGPGHLQTASAGIIALPYVPPSDLPPLYAGALALTLPSRFEGFGFPVLEAMRCGTPVLASSAGALPEIVGEAGVLLDPADERSWTQAMHRVNADEAERQRLIAAGLTWSAGFTWTATAAGVWRVLDEASA